MAENAFLELARIRRSGRNAVLATVVRGIGPTYRRPGASAVIPDVGPVAGAISGGCLENDVFEAASAVLAGGRPRLLEYNTAAPEDLVFGTGSGCGGTVHVLVAPVDDSLLGRVVERLEAGESVALGAVIAPGAALGVRVLVDYPSNTIADYWYEGDVFFQAVRPPVTLIVCGAGDDAKPVADMARGAGFRVVVADHRPLWATPERFPSAEQVVVCEPAELGSAVAIPPGSYAVLLTHHYEHDLAHLQALLEHPMAYVGLLGSGARSRRLVAQLLDERPDLADVARGVLHSPVGLDIGADGPYEIALSIVAELVAHRSGRSGGSLTAVRGRPIP